MHRNEIEEEEPLWVLNDDLPIEYPQYVKLLLDTGLRLGLPCEKLHALFQISGDWKLKSETMPCTEGGPTRSQEKENAEEHVESKGECHTVDVLSSSLFPVCESFENPSNKPPYCAHLQRESAALWMKEGPASLPSFHYCRKAVKKNEETKSPHSHLRDAHYGSSEEEGMPFSTTTVPSSLPALDCLYCFHKQLFKEATRGKKSKKGIQPAVVVETLAEESLEERKLEEEMEGEYEGEDDSTRRRKNILPPSSSPLLQHYHTHRCRAKKMLTMLEEEEEKEKKTPGNDDSSVIAEGLSVEAVVESESRHCTFVCAAGTSITPVVVTYCAECEMFGPLARFEYRAPFDEQEFEVENDEGAVKWGCTESSQREGDKEKSSPSSLNPCSWISTEPSSIIAARLMLALYVLRESLPDIMSAKTPWDACGSCRSSVPSLILSPSPFSPSSFPMDDETNAPTVHKGMVETVVVGEEEGEEQGTRKETNKLQRTTKVKEEIGGRSKETQAEDSFVGNSVQSGDASQVVQDRKSVDLRSFPTDPFRRETTNLHNALCHSKYLFLPTPLLFQDPPPSLMRQTLSFTSSSSVEGNKTEASENLDQGRDIMGEQYQPLLDPRQYLTDTFENNMEGILCVDAMLPGACWVRVHNREHTSDPLQMKKKTEEEEKMLMVGRDGKEEEGVEQDGAAKGADRGGGVQDPSHFSPFEGHDRHHLDKTNHSSSTEGHVEHFLLYLSSTTNSTCAEQKSPVEVIPWKEGFAWEEGGEEENGEGREDTPLHHHDPKPLLEGVPQEEINSQDGEGGGASSSPPPPPPCETASRLLSSFSASTAALVMHDVVVGMLVEFSSAGALGKCVEEVLVPQIQREEKEKEGGASESRHQQPLRGEHNYYPLPCRLTHRAIFHPDEERWLEAVVLYSENYSYPMKLEEDVAKEEGEEEQERSTCREWRRLQKERWLGDDKNGFRRACLSHRVLIPFSSDEMKYPCVSGSGTLFPTSQLPLPKHYSAPVGAAGYPLFTSSQKEKVKKNISGAEEEKLERQGEEEENSLRFPSSTCSSLSSSLSGVPLLEDPHLILTTHHPFSIEAHRVKALISAVVAGQAIGDALLQMS